MNILHLREPQEVVNDARCATTPDTCSQSLTPYNKDCFDP
jgi:hypothetical protein